MLQFNVRRLTAAVALVLVLAAAPALAVPGPRPHVTQAPVAGLSLLDRLLDWLGLPAAAGVPSLHSLYQKSTAGDPDATASGTQRTTLSRGGQIDPNG
jgi:hypothetical protein